MLPNVCNDQEESHDIAFLEFSRCACNGRSGGGVLNAISPPREVQPILRGRRYIFATFRYAQAARLTGNYVLTEGPYHREADIDNILFLWSGTVEQPLC
jgi:hypothetical protein